MKDRIRVIVTHDHIRRAKNIKAQETHQAMATCPIAIALREQLNLSSIYVGTNFIRAYTLGSDPPTSYDIPQKAEVFIMKYDKDEPVNPISFTICKAQNPS